MKIAKLFAVLLISLLFTGCLDVFHFVSIHDSEADIAFRYTIQSALLEMVSAFSEEEIDITELLSEADSAIPLYDDVSFEGKPIDTSFHKGIEMHMRGNIDTMKVLNEKRFFFPVKVDDHYSILIPSIADDEEMDEMAAVFLSGSKYTMLIDLHGDLKDITGARLVFDDTVRHPSDEDSPIGVNIYGSAMLIEIPILFLFYAPDDFSIELY